MVLGQMTYLLLVDYMMPELDGMAFIEAFRAAPGRL